MKIGAIRIERVYQALDDTRGKRFLVERLWPRGVKKTMLKMDAWLKEVAPSDALRRWFSHDPAKWSDFQRRYRSELEKKPAAWLPLLEAARSGDVVLLFSSKDVEHNNAVALKTFLEEKIGSHSGR
jgi:uncharacterized protein YeaO (DUF488 family)